MATRGKLISDIELRLTKGKPSDDLELERSQIGHWLDVTRDEMVQATLNDMLRRGEPIDTFYIYRETCITPTVEDLACVADTIDEYRFTLTYTPMNLIGDQGVTKVITDEHDLVYPTTLEELSTLRDMQFTAPSIDNFIYFRENKKLVFYGLNRNVINDPSFIVWYVPQYTSATPDESAEFIIRDELVGPMLDQVEAIAKRQMYGSMEDLENDSEQDLNTQ